MDNIFVKTLLWFQSAFNNVTNNLFAGKGILTSSHKKFESNVIVFILAQIPEMCIKGLHKWRVKSSLESKPVRLFITQAFPLHNTI